MPSHEQLVLAQRAAETDLVPLLQALQATLQAGREPPASLLQLIALTAASHAAAPARDAAAQTLASLIRTVNLPARAQAAALQISATRGQLLAQRAGAVLTGRSAAYVTPYTRLAAQVLIWDSSRAGAGAGAQEGGATHKTFTRLRPVREPRAHSSLEGLTIPIDQPFIIAGIPCEGPGDPALPWSERAWCGHILRYSRR